MKTFKVLKKRAATLALACVLAISAMPVFAGTAVEKPSADVKPGMYRQTKQVALSAQNGAKIYYTTNNLMPTENDTEYTSPITVSADTNICAIAVKDGVKSSAATFGYLIRTEEQPKMQFVVMSDMHIGDGLNVEGGGENVYDLDKARTFKAMEVMSNIFSNPDLMVINGDLIKHNNGYPSKEADHATFIKLIKDSMKQYGMENTPVQVTIGNHDSQGNDVSAMKAYYDADETAKDWFPGENGYYHKEVNGLDFIYIDSNHNTAEQKAFLSDTLAQIKEEKGESSPIFVFFHIPIKGTLDDDSWTCSADWKTILADYPQAIVFSGHTHYSVTEDCSISQEAGFTAVNDGSMSYTEKIDTAKEMVWNSTDGTQKKAYQFPVTQGLAVEVYGDRVEINRITVNGDRGDVKVNNYVAAEPFDNCGAYAGEKWTVKIGSTADEWKDNFTYTKSQRRANDAAPEFAEGTQPAISGSGRTATVSFPQTVNPRNTDKYAIELVNSNTGKTEKTVKVWSENVFTPMPEKLEYTVDGLNPGTTYYAKVTAYNVYGAASAPAISADTFTTEEIPGRKPQVIAQQYFSEIPTDEDNATTIVPYVFNYKYDGIIGTGTMSFADGNAKWVSNNKGGTNLMMPFNVGTTVADGKYTPKNLDGEFYYEFDLTRLSAVGSQNLNMFLRNGGGTNMARIVVGTSSIRYEYYSAKSKFSTYATASVSGSTHKIRIMLGSDGNTQYISGLWVDGKEISTKKQAITIASNADSWKLIAVEPASSWVVGDMCSVDNVKVWRSAENQAKELAAAEDGKISFEQIKGENASADAVTANLELKAGEEAALQTANKMLVVGWKSDKPDVVDENGVVTRQAYDTEVALTPVLAIIDSDSGAYVTADGAAIGVIVKRVKAAFTDADGKIVSSLDGTITKAVADVSDLGENAVVAAGLYSGNKLENVWIGEKDSGYADVALDGELEGKTLKLFVWEDGTWKPLGEAVEL